MNLITGATGLLGSHIAEKLVEAGQPVRALVRKNSDTRILEAWGVELVYGDVTEPQSIAEAMKGVKTVYHSAAGVGDWGSWDNYFVPVTIGGTRNMIESAKRENVERFLHISTISSYGHIMTDDVVDETWPLGELGKNLNKWSYYSRAKIEAEKLVRKAHAAGDICATIAKPSWLYGPRDRASVPRMIKALKARKAKLLGNGTNKLNLTYAGNEAEGCILAATAECAKGQTYNLSSDGDITQAEYFNKVAECIGAKPVTRKVPFKVAYNAAFMMELFGHLTHRKTPPLVTRYSVWLIGRKCFFSPEKARRELGWKPTVGYEEGIQRSVRWCMDNLDL